MKINDVEFDFNATKLSGMEALDKAMPPCAKAVLDGVKLAEKGHYYDGAKMQIDAFRQFFLDLVGVDVVKDCDDVALATAMFEDFNKQIEEQKKRVKEEYFKRK